MPGKAPSITGIWDALLHGQDIIDLYIHAITSSHMPRAIPSVAVMASSSFESYPSAVLFPSRFSSLGDPKGGLGFCENKRILSARGQLRRTSLCGRLLIGRFDYAARTGQSRSSRWSHSDARRARTLFVLILASRRGIMPRSCCALALRRGGHRETAILSRASASPPVLSSRSWTKVPRCRTVWLSRTTAQQRA